MEPKAGREELAEVGEKKRGCLVGYQDSAVGRGEGNTPLGFLPEESDEPKEGLYHPLQGAGKRCGNSHGRRKGNPKGGGRLGKKRVRHRLRPSDPRRQKSGQRQGNVEKPQPRSGLHRKGYPMKKVGGPTITRPVGGQTSVHARKRVRRGEYD